MVAGFSHAAKLNYGPLPRASQSPANIDPALDCAIKQLAWNYAKKLLPFQGDFMSVYDALQLGACAKSPPPQSYEHMPCYKPLPSLTTNVTSPV